MAYDPFAALHGFTQSAGKSSRFHPALKANFPMRPSLAVAFASDDRVAIDLTREPLGICRNGQV